jgi:hypothetical protein
MPDPSALLAFLDATLGDSITLSLRQLGQIVGWAPPSGRWTTDDCSGPEGRPTPLLQGLTLALDAGWRLTALPSDIGIVFTDPREPLAPVPADTRPRDPRPTPIAEILVETEHTAEPRRRRAPKASETPFQPSVP